MSYQDIYDKRLNRYGTDYQSRVQNQREHLFEEYLKKSIYRVDFEYNNVSIPGTLEKYQQDTTQTMQYLLVRIDQTLNPGSILAIDNIDWMVFYLEQIKSSGYNRYVVIKMSHSITWKDSTGAEHTSYAYMRGPKTTAIEDQIMSKNPGAVYLEQSNLTLFVMPLNQALKKDDYFEIGTGELKECYRVTGRDIQSSPGVMYVSADVTYARDNTPAPTQGVGDEDKDFFWMGGK